MGLNKKLSNIKSDKVKYDTLYIIDIGLLGTLRSIDIKAKIGYKSKTRRKVNSTKFVFIIFLEVSFFINSIN